MAAASRIGGEIVSVDSMKIYRGLDVGTAKPSADQRSVVPHHGLDLVEPTEIFSVARYVAVAEEAVAAIAGRDRSPVLSGGTALYYKGLLWGLFEGPSADEALRDELKRRAAEEGVEALHAELLRLDPVAAARIHANDLRRVVRALEVARLTGRPISGHQEQWSREALRYRCGIVGLLWSRDLLVRRIEERVDRMLASGLVEEARTVYDRRAMLARTPLQAVAYKEFFPYFEGEATLADARELLIRNTRRLAKSQMTWFRKFPARWIVMEPGRDAESVAEEVCRLWNEMETT